MTPDRLPSRCGTAGARGLRGSRAAALALAFASAAAVLGGCASSPPSHFYTLSPTGDAARAVASPSAANPALLIELAPVDVPPQVAKPQFVVQDNATQVRVLEQQRWASLPGDEIRRALSGDLTQQLGTIDVYGNPHPDGVPVYRVSVNVQRFESWPGSHALVDAVWSVRSLTSQAVMTCRSVLDEPVGDGYDALVAGHRRAVDALATAIASGVRSLAAQPVRVGAKSSGSAAQALVACPAPVAAAPATTAAPATQ